MVQNLEVTCSPNYLHFSSNYTLIRQLMSTSGWNSSICRFSCTARRFVVGPGHARVSDQAVEKGAN